MEIITLGRVVTEATIENLEDLYEMEKGRLATAAVRQVHVEDALVDTGATMLSLPSRLVAQLGLRRLRSRQARTTAGTIPFDVFGTVQLTIQGRECRVDVAEVPDGCPVLVGQVPLELLDFVVDPSGQKLIGNPEHGGQHMIDMF